MRAKKQNQSKALEESLVPLCRLLLGSGITAVEFQLAIGKASVAAAQESARLKNGKINQSRVALMTGFSRTEIRRLLAGTGALHETNKTFGAKRIVDGWARDPEFSTRTGKRRALPIRGGYGSFQSLCKKYSGDIPFKAAMDELMRIGLVRRDKTSVAFISAQATPIRTSGQAAITFLSKQLSMALGSGATASSDTELVAEDSIEVQVAAPGVREIAKDRARQSARAFMNGLANTLQPLADEKRLGALENRRSLRVKVAIELVKPGAG